MAISSTTTYHCINACIISTCLSSLLENQLCKRALLARHTQICEGDCVAYLLKKKSISLTKNLMTMSIMPITSHVTRIAKNSRLKNPSIPENGKLLNKIVLSTIIVTEIQVCIETFFLPLIIPTFHCRAQVSCKTRVYGIVCHAGIGMWVGDFREAFLLKLFNYSNIELLKKREISVKLASKPKGPTMEIIRIQLNSVPLIDHLALTTFLSIFQINVMYVIKYLKKCM